MPPRHFYMLFASYLELKHWIMKKMLIVAFAIVVTLNVQAQRRGGFPSHGGGYYSAPRIVVPFYRPYYNPFYNPFYNSYGLGYGYYPPAVNTYNNRPSKLTIAIQDIKNDYGDKITSVRSDDSLSGKDRRAKIRAFKHERNQLIDDTKRNYYKK